MKSESLLNSKLNIDDNGFSIVELLIAVAILAFVFTPVLRSFTMASITNSKAQVIQDATSVAEMMMEEIKSTSINGLYEEAVHGTNSDDIKFTSGSNVSEESTFNNNPPYRIEYKNVSATQGKPFDVTVDISTDEYSKTEMDSISGVNNANINGVPRISSIKSDEHAVLSWELNQFDGAAKIGLVDENAKNESEYISISNNIVNSAVKITYVNVDYDKDISGNNTGYIRVSCDVEYKCKKEDDSSKKTLKYHVFTGYYDDISSSKAGGPNIYLFYTPSELYPECSGGNYFHTEYIYVNDSTTTCPLESSKKTRHNVYLILQDSMKDLKTPSGNSKIEISVGGNAYNKGPVRLDATTDRNNKSIFLLSNGNDAIDETEDDVYLYTNLQFNDAITNEVQDGELFSKYKKDRIYYVTVSVSRDGKTFASLTSTMKTGSESVEK